MSNIKQNHGWRSEITVFHNLIEEHISLNVIGLSVCYKRLQHCFKPCTVRFVKVKTNIFASN